MPGVRVVTQSVESASLLVDNQNQWIDIGPGLIIYVCFLTEANEMLLQDAVLTVTTNKLIHNAENFQHMSVLETGGDILVIPQASLAGKLKKKSSIQYHTLAEKQTGAKLFQQFVQLLREKVESNENITMSHRERESDHRSPVEQQILTRRGRVYCGTYGNRQALKFISNGPYTHYFEF